MSNIKHKLYIKIFYKFNWSLMDLIHIILQYYYSNSLQQNYNTFTLDNNTFAYTTKAMNTLAQ